MLKRDILTKNLAILVDKVQQINNKIMDDPDEALKMVESVEDTSILDQLTQKSGQILLVDDQMVKAQIDLAFAKANILQKQGKKLESKAQFQQVYQHMQSFQEIFPKNFPFDFFSKMAIIKNNI